LDNGIKEITVEHKIKVAQAIAGLIKKPTSDKIVPDIFNKKTAKVIAEIFKTKKNENI